MAIGNRKFPERDLIYPSDRGLQNCNSGYIDELPQKGIRPSMTTKYDPYENAIEEKINGILKTEHEIGDGFVGEKDAKREFKFVIW